MEEENSSPEKKRDFDQLLPACEYNVLSPKSRIIAPPPPPSYERREAMLATGEGRGGEGSKKIKYWGGKEVGCMEPNLPRFLW